MGLGGGAERGRGAPGSGARPRGMGRDPGPRGVQGPPASGVGGHCGSNCQRCPGSPPLAAEGAGSGGGGRRGSPVSPRGGGPRGLTPPGRKGSLLFLCCGGRPPLLHPRPTPTRGGSRACARDPRPSRAVQSRAAEPQACGERRRGAALGGPRAWSPLPPPAGLSLPPPGHPLPRSPPPSPRFGFLSYSSPPLLSSQPRQTPLLASAVSHRSLVPRDPRKAD